jgi:hypothetical protein
MKTGEEGSVGQIRMRDDDALAFHHLTDTTMRTLECRKSTEVVGTMQASFSSLLTAGIGISIALTLACGRNSPDAPTPHSTPTASLAEVYLCCEGQIALVGESRQLQAFAKFSDGSITDVTQRATWQSSNAVVATVSTTGLLTIAREGDAEIRAAYQGMEGAWVLRILSPTRSGPPAADEVVGKVHEVAPREDVNVPFARVEIFGGDGRFVTADSSGEFRFDGIQAAGFDLLVTRTGYQSARYRIQELPRDATARIAIEPEPWLVSDVFEGNFCARNPQSTFFTPRHRSGLFRVTSYKRRTFESAAPTKLLVNGIEAFPIVYMHTDYQVQADTEYELRLSGATDFPSCTGTGPYDGSFRLTYLRPR